MSNRWAERMQQLLSQLIQGSYKNLRGKKKKTQSENSPKVKLPNSLHLIPTKLSKYSPEASLRSHNQRTEMRRTESDCQETHLTLEDSIRTSQTAARSSKDPQGWITQNSILQLDDSLSPEQVTLHLSDKFPLFFGKVGTRMVLFVEIVK